MSVCVCVCECLLLRARVSVWLCVSVCVCVCGPIPLPPSPSIFLSVPLCIVESLPAVHLTSRLKSRLPGHMDLTLLVLLR